MQTRGTSERRGILLITCFCLACCFGLAQVAQAHDAKSDPSFNHLDKVVQSCRYAQATGSPICEPRG